MRQFKFRVWHKPEKKMHYYLKAKFGQGTNITLEGKFKDVDQITTKTVPNEDLEVMQFIGLLDKNGNEVFEGDLLKIGQLTGRYEVVWQEDGAYFRARRVGSDTGYSFTNISYPFEVIGNIYENSELLK